MSAQVIALRKTKIRHDLVEHYETMLTKAKCGMVDGCVDFTQSTSGEQFIAVCGSFAEDRASALDAASRVVAFLDGPARTGIREDSAS